MDLTTTYMGLELTSPLVLAAGPISRSIDRLRKAEQAGAGAAVLWSVFEEQFEHDAEELDHYLHYGTERFAESLSYFPEVSQFHLGPDDYLRHIEKAKQAVKMPILGSLNGVSARGWTAYARRMQDAGADAVELNIYYIPANPDLSADEVENVYLAILRAVKDAVTVPVAVKLSPYFSATANMFKRLDEAGADGLVLFNRFYQPDIDLSKLEVVANLTYSTSFDARLPLRWIALTYGRVAASLAATSGVHTGADAAKMILAGADVTMLASALLRNGVEHLATVREQLVAAMNVHGYQSVKEMRGVLSQKSCAEPSAFERANYMKALTSFGPTATLE